MKTNILVLQALDGSIKVLDNVEGFYYIGSDIVFVKFLDGGERYYSNYKVYTKEVKKC
jgi:hypothetical protein